MAKGKSSKMLGSGLLLLLIVGLAGFGARNFGGSVQSIGRVGDTEIEINRYARELTQELRAFEAQTGMAFTMDQARQFGIDKQVLSNLVAQVALEDEAARIGVSVGDAKVRDQIYEIPAFAGADGRFNAETYRFALQNAGLTAPEFETAIRTELARNILQTAVLPAAPMPAKYTDAIMSWVGERRDIAWLTLGPDDLDGALPAPTDDALQAFYDDNPGLFTLPAAKNITYAWLAPDAVTGTGEVDEAELRSLYEARIEEYVTPERRLVERLIFGTDEQAQAAADAIASGAKTFETVVAERGLELSDIDLGDVGRDDVGAAAADAVFAPEDTGVVGPVETDLGPALFRVNVILHAQEVPFDEARDALRDEYLADAARREIAARSEAIDDMLAGGATLEELASEEGMALGMIRWTPETGDGIAAYQEFAEAAAAVTADDYPEVLQLPDGGIFALRLDADVPAELRPFDEVRDEVAAAWAVHETEARLGDQARTLAATIDADTGVDRLGRSTERASNLLRTGFLDNTPDSMVEDLFDTAPGAPLVLVDRVDGTPRAVIAVVEAVKPAASDNPDAQRLRTQLATQLTQSLAQDLLGAFTADIRDTAGIQINQAALNAVHAQMGN